MKYSILPIILIVCVVCPIFGGCGNGDLSMPTLDNTGNRQSIDMPNTQDDNNESQFDVNHNLAEPDYSDFVMPEETDTLVLYSDEGTLMFLKKAMELFQKQYPNVQIEHKHYSQDECEAILQAEIPAGKGPDLLFSYYGLLPDIYKTMDSGVLVDLNPYMANDPDFSLSDYNEGVLNGGVINGKRYIVPINYTIPMLLTTEELLFENGIDPSSLNSFDGFINACTEFREKNPEKRLFTTGASNYYLQNLYEYSGLRMIDYEKKEISINEERFNKIMDLCRLYYKNPPEDGFMDSQIMLYRRETMFGNCETTEFSYFTAYAVIKYMQQETPIFCTVPNEDDGVTASIFYFSGIPVGAQNKINGYRFLKILLSDEYQNGIEDDNTRGQYGTMPVGLPVRTESLQKHLSYVANHIDLGDPDLVFPIGDEEVEKFCQVTENITDSALIPKILFSYVKNTMMQYISGKMDYEKAYAKLYNTLDIYKDE